MTDQNTRRRFLKQAAFSTTLAFVPYTVFGSMKPNEKRKFKMCLNPGAVGVQVNQEELLDKAAEYGFEAIVPFSSTLAEWGSSQINEFTDKMRSKGISWGASGLPLNFRNDKESYLEGLRELPKHALALQKAGVTRMSTWIMPTHDFLTYRENFKLHTERLKEVAIILNDRGIKLGFEYVGPKTLMASQKFSYIHTMAECKEMVRSIDEPNTGLQLDAFHWYCAGETKEDLLSLSNEDIITIDLNDAREGFDRDEQIDGKRELPMATGVVDLKAFMEALVAIGYDGPIRAEPFNQALNDMDNEAALKATSSSMKKAFALVE